MNSRPARNTINAPAPTVRTRALRKRVEQLEIAREEAHILRDVGAIKLIDLQIEEAIAEWQESFVVGVEERVRKAG